MELLRSILLVEDNEDDVILFKHALRRAKIAGEVIHLGGAREAMEYLEAKVKAGESAPDIAFLDLSSAGGMGAFELVAWMGDNLKERCPRIWILTGSDSPKNRDSAKQLPVAGYAIKPPDAALFDKIAQHHGAKWAEA